MYGAIYQADMWCADCAESIKSRIQAEGNAPADPDDEYSYDSDEYPKDCDCSCESDSPQHCAAGEDCINAITFDDRPGIGCWLENDLTSHGEDYVVEAVNEARDGHGCSEVTDLWKGYYDYIDFRRLMTCNGCGEDFDSDDLDDCNYCEDCAEEYEKWRCPGCGAVIECVVDYDEAGPPHCVDCARDMDRFDPTDTVFLRDCANGRGHPAGPVFAIFPGIAATVGRPEEVTCYAHTGQHHAANLSYCEDQTEVTDPAEYADLAAELLSRGYNVRVVPKDSIGGADYTAARRRQLQL
jgi:hypothetical protein